MEVWMIVTLVVALLILFLVIEMPVAFALGVSGGLGLILMMGTGHATNVLASVPYLQTASISLTVIPMFLLMGTLAVSSGISSQLFTLMNRVFALLPGGLGVAAIAASAGFAAVSGSSIATASTIAKISVGEMRRYGYPAAFATGIVAMGGTLGVLIPPSLFIVLYAITVGESVGKSLIAGIIPGILTTVVFASLIMVMAPRQLRRERERREALSLAAPERTEAQQTVGGSVLAAVAKAKAKADTSGAASAVKTATWTSKGSALGLPTHDETRWRDLPWRSLIYIVILFAIVMGSLFAGLVTVTESAAIGAFAALVIFCIEMRGRSIRELMRTLGEALRESAGTTGMVFTLIIGSAILSVFFVMAKVPDAIQHGIMSLGIPGWATVALLLAMLIPLGMVLDELSMMVLTLPLIYPVAMDLGFDGIWLGIMFITFVQIGLVAPPVGINCFVISGVTGVKTETVYRGVMPFLMAELGIIVLLFIFPDIITWLPSLIRE